MECGKLTAKLRDAVPVCFIEDGKEIKRFKNIEIPDELKALPFADFKFEVPATGAISFKIMFEAGILPKEWPQARERKSRSPKAAPVAETEVTSEAAQQPDEPQVEAMQEAAEEPMQESTTALATIQPDPLADIIEAAERTEAIEATKPVTEQPAEEMVTEEAEVMVEVEQPAEEEAEEIKAEPESFATMEIDFNVMGDRRKALVEAVSSFIGTKPVYQNAPTFGYAISEYTVDKKGTLTGPKNDNLLQALAAKGFIVE